MTDTTANLNLVVTTDDDNRLFVVWRAGLDGVSDSNMTKIDAFSGNFVGGNKGQFLVKKSNDKFEFEWVNLDEIDGVATQILIKRGKEEKMPTLAVGELGFATDTNRLFIGTNNDGNQRVTKGTSASDVFVDDATSIYDNYSVSEALEEIAGDLGNVNTILENVLGV